MNWKDHDGSPCPVPGATVVETVDNRGELWTGPASEWLTTVDNDGSLLFDCWNWAGNPMVTALGCAIVRYRVLEEPRASTPVAVEKETA